ncbi:hypothetical protein Vretimale_5818 [Volvox reticuliferus]|uniref:Uncharacterized protein n=1 Tax=Volvox reticuliferus TaxID=1737510 RepID=A0A8J4C7J3_9CHLO|nr:hypothetical protein Vretifemale_5676 [Volvox reticuliferus]GIM00933.1 hypothetical protein Vretimale_5818 [Volvox reticuliferus]
MADYVLIPGPADTASKQWLSPSSTSTCTSAQPPIPSRSYEFLRLTCSPCTFHGYPDNPAVVGENGNTYCPSGSCGVTRSIAYEIEIPIPVSCPTSGAPLAPASGMGGDGCGGDVGVGRQRTLKLYALPPLKVSPSVSADLRDCDGDGLASSPSHRFPSQGQPSPSEGRVPQRQQQQHPDWLHSRVRALGCTAAGNSNAQDASDLHRAHAGEQAECRWVPAPACCLTITSKPSTVSLARPSTSHGSRVCSGCASGPVVAPPHFALHRKMQHIHQETAVKHEDVVLRDGDTKDDGEATPVLGRWLFEHETSADLCRTPASRGPLGQLGVTAAASGASRPKWSEVHTAEPNDCRTYDEACADERKRQSPHRYAELRLAGRSGPGAAMAYPSVTEHGAGALREAALQATCVMDSAAVTELAARANSPCRDIVQVAPEAITVTPSSPLFAACVVLPDESRIPMKVYNGRAEDMDPSNDVRTCLAVQCTYGGGKEVPAPAAAIFRGSASGGGGFIGSEDAAGGGGGIAASGDLCTGDTTPSSTSTLPSPPPVGPFRSDQQQHHPQHGCAKRVCEDRIVRSHCKLRLYPLAAHAMLPPALPQLPPPVEVSAPMSQHFHDDHILAAADGTLPPHSWADTAAAAKPDAVAAVAAATEHPRAVPDVLLVHAMESSSRGDSGDQSTAVSSEESADGPTEPFHLLHGVRQDETFRRPFLKLLGQPWTGPTANPPLREATAPPDVGLTPAMAPWHLPAPAARTARLGPGAYGAPRGDLTPTTGPLTGELPNSGLQSAVCRAGVWCHRRRQCGNMPPPQRCRGEELGLARCEEEVVDLTTVVGEDEVEREGADEEDGREVKRQSGWSVREDMYVLPEGHGLPLVVLGGAWRKRRRQGRNNVESAVGDRKGPIVAGGTPRVLPLPQQWPHIEQAAEEVEEEDQQGEKERREQKQGQVQRSRCGWARGRQGGLRKPLRVRGTRPRNSVL